MLFAASESAVTKKPRLRLMMRRSSSLSPPGVFHSALSRVMVPSRGIQGLAQLARYFSQAHLYLSGTSWLTSVWPLMMRLSAAFTRRCAASGAWCRVPLLAGAMPMAGRGVVVVWKDSGACLAWRLLLRPPSNRFCAEGLTSSSQVNIDFPVVGL